MKLDPLEIGGQIEAPVSNLAIKERNVYCPECGTQNDSTAAYCNRCGKSLSIVPEQQGVISRQPVRDLQTYLVPSILVTICCCAPLGIVPLFFAARASGKASAGDYENALQDAQTAKMWCWIVLALGLLFQIIRFILWIMIVLPGLAESTPFDINTF